MKRICSLVSIMMLVALASIQLVQVVHHHDGSHHFAKHFQSSSHEDLQLTDTKCFICTFHSNKNADTAILPAVFKLVRFMPAPLVLAIEADCAVKPHYPHTSYNKGPPVPMMLSF